MRSTKPAARRRLGIQRLESRQLLSADGLGVGDLGFTEPHTGVQPAIALDVAKMIAPADLDLLNDLGARAGEFQRISLEFREGGQVVSRDTIPVTPGPSGFVNDGATLQLTYDRDLESNPGHFPFSAKVTNSPVSTLSMPPKSLPVYGGASGGGAWRHTDAGLDTDSEPAGTADELLGGMPDLNAGAERPNPSVSEQPQFDADLEPELDFSDHGSESLPSWLSESPDAGDSMPDSPTLDADLADAGYADWLDSQDGMRQSMDELGLLIDTLSDDLHAPPPSTDLSQTAPSGADPISPGTANPPALKQLELRTTQSTESPQRSLPSSGEEQSPDSGDQSDSDSKAGAGDLSNRAAEPSPTKDAETKKSSETAGDVDTTGRPSQSRRLAGAGQMILLGQRAIEDEAANQWAGDSEASISPEMLATWSYGVGLYRPSEARAFAHGPTTPSRLASQPTSAPAEDLMSAAEVETLVTLWNMPAEATDELSGVVSEPEGASTRSFDEEAFAFFFGDRSGSDTGGGGGGESPIIDSISTTLQVGALAAGVYAWTTARRHAGKLSQLEHAHPPLA